MEAVYKDNENIQASPPTLKVVKIFRGLYTAYGLIVFAIFFFLFFPLLMIPVVFRKQFHLTGILNRWWARFVFTFVGLPWNITYHSKLKKDQQYIFCPNHFSYLDIAIMGLNAHNTIFVGKSAMERIPFFGFMYRSLHITVDREKLKSRYETMLKTMQALDEGKSLVIFPEGGIITEKDPVMSKFKDGAFRAAIEKQIPIVPVTIPFNWIILPPDEFLLRWKPMKLIFHEPIDPKDFTLDNIDEMKAKVKNVIQTELDRHLK